MAGNSATEPSVYTAPAAEGLIALPPEAKPRVEGLVIKIQDF